jgi:hypothetical protein
MAISRFQMNRQLRAYGGIMGQDGRRNYGIGSFFQEKIMDPIKNIGKKALPIAATLGGTYALGKFGSNPSTKEGFGGILENIFKGGSSAVKGAGKVLLGDKDNPESKGILSSLLTSRVALPIASGLIAGAFTKDKEDPIYTGQDVGLNLQDIAKLANISDPKTAAAIGLRFSPDVASRKFTPEEMAATYAANQERDFTEQREQAQDGGMMGDQKDFEEFLQDMQNRDKSMLQDRILQDFEKFMKRKRMLEQLPEAKDGGIMKMAEGGMMDMGGMEMDLRGGGFVPMGRAEKADDVPARLSKNEFVFTADAVRAAGGGNVDKGADKMYATMKKLEDRVA